MSGPAVRPHTGRGAFLTAEWRDLVMLNFEVDPALLLPLLPAGTMLDLFDGRALASIVGFRFRRTRVLGIPVPLHRDFEEVNLRFYVRRELPDGEVRRGAVFVRELVPRRAIAVVARLVYNEPYLALAMRSSASTGDGEERRRVAYEWRLAGEWQHVAATAAGNPTLPLTESEAAFVTEHYWGYTRQRNGGTIEYEVRHPRWSVWPVEAPSLEANAARLYGAAFVDVLARAPVSALIADGSAVVVHRPHRIAPGHAAQV